MTSIIYNVTVNIDHDVHDEWLEWMKSIHIPEVMKTGMFRHSKISRILAEEEGGISYSVMYQCDSMEIFTRYEAEFAPTLRDEHSKKFQGKFVAFRTLLEVKESFE